MPKPVRQHYTGVQIALHWAIATLIGVQFLVSNGMQQAFHDRMQGADAPAGWGAWVHGLVGSAILVLAVARLFVRLTGGVPGAHAGKPAFVTWMGHVTHLALYLVIFAMPLTGLLAWYASSDIAAEVHEAARWLLVALVVLHLVGALAEHFVFRNDGLARMFRFEDG